MARVILELDVERARSLSQDTGIPADIRRPMIEALKEYDRLKAAGEDAMLYIDSGALYVGRKERING